MAMTKLQLALLQTVRSKEANGDKLYEVSIKSFADGAPIKIKPIKSNDFFRITKQCTKDGTYDPIAFRLECIAEALVDPDLHDAEFRDALKCPTEAMAVLKVFDEPAIINALYDKIDEISNTDVDDELTFRECGKADNRVA